MFDIGWSELVLIGIVALIVIGPKELPTALRTAGMWMGKVRRMASEFQGQFQEAMREAEMADIKKEVEKIGSVASDLTFEPFDQTAKDLNRSVGDQPAQPVPAVADAGPDTKIADTKPEAGRAPA